MSHSFRTIFGLSCLLLLSVGCSTTNKAPKAGPNGEPLLQDGRYLASYDAFVADPEYRNTRDVWYHDERISQANAKNSTITIHLKNQRGVLKVNNQVAMDFPVCTGKSTHETPRGTFKIIQKDADYRSHTYGSVFDAAGNCVNDDATSSSRVPTGGQFIGAKMPLWMRIHGGVGLHVGKVYRDANSHGCIRVPIEACQVLFDHCGLGTTVVVLD
jgi:lipoprotein-anchoring transpeptidase ErfK/SrfK